MQSRLLALVLALLGLPAHVTAASAQEPGRIYRLGWLQVGSPGIVPRPVDQWTGPTAAFRDVLRDSGYVPGKNLIVEMRTAQGDVTRLAAEAEALVASKVDVIVSGGTPPTTAAMNATKTIPIVFPGVGTPVEKGIVASLARPGGNLTGVAVNIEFPKMWQLLREVAPATRRAGYLSYRMNSYGLKGADEFRATYRSKQVRDAAAVGIEMFLMGVGALDEIEPTFSELVSRGGSAIYIATDSTLSSWRTSIMEMASRHRLVSACAQEPEWAKAGCVLTYGEDPYDRLRRAAAQVVKVLRGTKPGDIPVEQPTKFFLIVNVRAAKALDITVPTALLALADEVIE